jgi:xylan 1,4-beta-xylosidase
LYKATVTGPFQISSKKIILIRVLIYGVPKPAYRAYELMHRLGEERLAVDGEHATVDTWIFKKEGAIQLLITNSVLPKQAVQTEKITVQLKSDKIPHIKNSFVERIDDYHANATQAWIEMGSPQSLSAAQVAELETASLLLKENIDINYQDNNILISIEIPPQGVACITLETE